MSMNVRNGYIPRKKTTQTTNFTYTVQPDHALETHNYSFDTDDAGYDTAMQGYQAGMSPAAVPAPNAKDGCATNGFEDTGGMSTGFIWTGTLNGVYGNHRVPADSRTVEHFEGTGYSYPDAQCSTYLHYMIYTNALLGAQSYTLPSRTISVDDILVDDTSYPTTQYAAIRTMADGSDAYVAANAAYFIAICTCEQVQYYSDPEKTTPTSIPTPWYDVTQITVRQRYSMRYGYTEIAKSIPDLPKKYEVIETEE